MIEFMRLIIGEVGTREIQNNLSGCEGTAMLRTKLETGCSFAADTTRTSGTRGKRPAFTQIKTQPKKTQKVLR